MFREWSIDLVRFLFLAMGIVIVASISGNIYVASALILPVIFAIIVFDQDPCAITSIEIEGPDRSWVGDEVTFNCRINLSSRRGLVNVELPLPRQFDMTDGNNVHVFHKTKRMNFFEFEFKTKILSRGNYDLDQMNYTIHAIAGEFRKRSGIIGTSKKIEVLPRIEIMKKRTVKTFSRRYVPKSSVAKIGPPSTEFDSIRSYVHGDPFRTINWKATARMSGNGAVLVNRYEREGISTSLMVLDRGAYMRKGTLEINPFESGVSAVLSLSKLLLERGVNTGFWYGQKLISKYGYVLPSTDMENFQRIKRAILVGNTSDSMKSAIDPGINFYHSLIQNAANILFVTNLTVMNSTVVNYFIRNVTKNAGNVVLLDVLPYGVISRYNKSVISELYGQQVLRKSSQRLYDQLPGGTKIISWDPVLEKMGGVIGRIANYMR